MGRTVAQPAAAAVDVGGRGRSRRLGSRPPSGRAFVGAALIVVAAAGVLVAHRSASQPPTERYVVAVHAIGAGSELRAEDLGTVAMDLPRGVAAVAEADAEQLIGRVATTGIAADELLRPSDTYDTGRFTSPNTVEVAVDLPAANALHGVIGAGSLVDVLRTDPDQATTVRLASGVRVSAIDQGDESGIGADGTVRVLLSVTGVDAATSLVDAARRAELTLVLPRPSEATP